MKLLRTAIVTVLLVVLSGCVVHSSQLSGLISLFSSPELDLAENSWSVRYGDYQAVVYAIAVPDGTSFSNSTGDQIFFDGLHEMKSCFFILYFLLFSALS